MKKEKEVGKSAKALSKSTHPTMVGMKNQRTVAFAAAAKIKLHFLLRFHLKSLPSQVASKKVVFSMDSQFNKKYDTTGCGMMIGRRMPYGRLPHSP